MAGHKNQASLFGAGSGPLEVVFRMHRLIVFVNSDEGHVDVEAWKVEVVWIATKERSLEFRHEHETHVRVFLVAIQIVLTALIKRDYVGTQSCRFQRVTLY